SEAGTLHGGVFSPAGHETDGGRGRGFRFPRGHGAAGAALDAAFRAGMVLPPAQRAEASLEAVFNQQSAVYSADIVPVGWHHPVSVARAFRRGKGLTAGFPSLF